MHSFLKSIFFLAAVSMITIGAAGCVDKSSDSADSSAAAALVINEIVAKGVDGAPDWIELYNAGEATASLSGYSLMDDNGFRERTQLPDTTLAPGEFIVLQAVDEAPEDGSYYVPFGLGADDVLTLYKGNIIIDTLDWEDGDAPEGSSYGRFPDGTEDAMTLTPTPREENG